MAEGNGKANHGFYHERGSWWPWTLGIASLMAVGVFLVQWFMSGAPTAQRPAAQPEPAPVMPPPVQPRLIRVPAELTPADRVPAEQGALAGCSLLLVTIDTTRADRIGCYGNPDIETPTLDRLARQGVLFSNAMAPVPTTLSSHASILTGLYPLHHGARANGLFRLADRHVTLAEVLAARGYATAAFVSAYVLNARFGLVQGFGHYDDDLTDGRAEQWYRVAECTADVTTQRAAAWLRARGPEPFFLWVHYFDPHAGYLPPSPYAERYGDFPYDGEIAFVDAQFGQLLDVVHQMGRSEQTLIVAVADHGEGLGQHNELTHEFLLYDSTLQVPLIMSCGQRLGQGVHVDRLVSLVDILPTVLSVLGVNDGPDTDGIDLTQPPADPRPIFAETFDGPMVYGMASLQAVRQGAIKYIHGPDPELYDLSQDPFEEHNLLASQPKAAEEMNGLLAAFFGQDLGHVATAQPTERLSPSEQAKLASLGYVAGAGQAPQAGPLPDPKQMMDLVNRVGWAMVSGSPQRAVAILEGIARDYPDFHMGYYFLAKAYTQAGQLARAESSFRRCLELHPDNPQTLLRLAQLKLQQQDPTEAAGLYRRVLKVSPEHLEAMSALGALLGRQGRFHEAAEQLTRAFALLPSDDEIRTNMVAALVGGRRVDEAIRLLSGALRANPDLDAARGSLFDLLMSNQRYRQAAVVARQGLQRRPSNLVLANNLAALLSASPDESVRDPAQGLAIARRICEQTGHTNPRYLYTLSVAHMAVEQFDEAIRVAQDARRIAATTGQDRLAETIRQRVEAWREKRDRSN